MEVKNGPKKQEGEKVEKAAKTNMLAASPPSAYCFALYLNGFSRVDNTFSYGDDKSH